MYGMQFTILLMANYEDSRMIKSHLKMADGMLACELLSASNNLVAAVLPMS